MVGARGYRGPTPARTRNGLSPPTFNQNRAGCVPAGSGEFTIAPQPRGVLELLGHAQVARGEPGVPLVRCEVGASSGDHPAERRSALECYPEVSAEGAGQDRIAEPRNFVWTGRLLDACQHGGER